MLHPQIHPSHNRVIVLLQPGAFGDPVAGDSEHTCLGITNSGLCKFGFRNLLDPLDFLVRHDVVVPDDVRAVPFILLLEEGDEQLRHPVAMVIPTEEPLLPSGGQFDTLPTTEALVDIPLGRYFYS